MANPEHLAVLVQGVKAWNTWRLEHPGLHPDLREAQFDEAMLPHANLSWADLERARLHKKFFNGADFRSSVLRSADLREAGLNGADLGFANLSGADLSGADLGGANFEQASLYGANLTGANLLGANFNGAILRDAEFTKASPLFTVFARVDLSIAKGLETMMQRGPSTVGIDTLYMSKGRIPEDFLRGCGLSDWEVQIAKLYDPSLSTAETTDIVYQISHLRNSQPFEYFSCFISCSNQDEIFAKKLYGDLRAAGVRCWFAPHDIMGGRKIHEQIDEAIRVHDKLLLILSEHSMASDWVGTEIADAREREAREKKQMLFPITIVPFEEVKRWKLFDAERGKDSAREVREYYIPDFSVWDRDAAGYQRAFERLVGALKAG